MDSINFGKIICYLGLLLVVIGSIIWLLQKGGLPIGKLFFDLSFHKKNVSFYFPLGSSIILSIVLTILANLLLYFFRK